MREDTAVKELEGGIELGKKTVADLKSQLDLAEEKMRKCLGRIEQLSTVEKEKNLKEETVKRLQSELEMLNKDIKGRLELENQRLRADLAKIREENQTLYKYRDNFDEMERQKFEEMRIKYEKELGLVRMMHGEQLERQRLTMEKLAREHSDQVKDWRENATAGSRRSGRSLTRSSAR